MDVVKGLTLRISLSTWCLLVLLVLSGAKPAAGEETAAPAKDLTALGPEELMKIEIATVYGASKFEQKVTEAPSSVSIVTADEIRKYGYRTIADILKSLRSFYITYDRNYDYVGVRGFGRSGDYNSRILLLIDGHRANDNVYDGAPVGTESPLDVDLIDRVEVIRGPGSSLYGSNAFFAVVNVITRRGADLKGLEVSGEAGSFDAYKGRATYGNIFGNGLEVFLSGSIFNSEGPSLFFKEFDSPATNNGMTDHTDYDRFGSAFMKLSYSDFTLEGAYSSRTKGIPTASFGTDFNDSRNKTVDARGYLDLKYERDLGNNVNVAARLFYDYFKYHGDYIYSGVDNKDLGWGTWWGGEVQVAARPFERHRLIIGSEYYDNIHQNQRNYDEDPYALYVDDKRKSQILAFYLQDEYTVMRNLILNAGVRYDHYSTFGGTVNPRLALIYNPFEKTTFKFLYGSAFRAPNVYELYYQDGGKSSEANPDLRPEKIKTYELICEQYFGSNLRGTITGFSNRIDDLISQMVDPSDNLLIFRNTGEVKAKGFEAELEQKWESGLTGRISYSFQEAKDVSTDEVPVNSPRHLVKLNVIVPLLGKKVFLGAEEQYTSRRKTLAGNFTNSAYITNLTLYSRNLLKTLEASVSIYNLFDYKYGDPGATEHRQDIIEQDGRVFRFKVTYTF